MEAFISLPLWIIVKFEAGIEKNVNKPILHQVKR